MAQDASGMTTPDDNSDWTPAKVKNGISEVVLALGFLSSLLTSYFGQDWGISKNAQAIAGLGVLLMPAVLAVSRALKHRGAQAANAAVAVARIHAIASLGPTAPRADLNEVSPPAKAPVRRKPAAP